MTSPLIAARTPTLISSDTGVHAINLGSPSAGELIVVVVSLDSTSTVHTPVIDKAFSGQKWNRSAAVVSGNDVVGVALWKVAEGSDALRLLIDDTQQSSAMCFRVTGHGSAVFIASATGSSTNADPPNGAITGSAQDILVIAVACHDGTVVASAAPASYGNLTTQAAAGAGGASISVADRAVSAATSENPGTFTSTTEQWVGFTIVIPENAIATNARPTQEAVEAVSLPSPNAVATQVAVEAISAFANHMVTTQVSIESLSPQTQNLYVTQVGVEVLSGDPWVVGSANKYRQIQIAC